MFGSEVLDVAIGLVFIYLVLSLICSAACELLESFWKRRAEYLQRGMSELFGGASGSALVKAIYDHPLVSSLFHGEYEEGKTGNLPSYIPAHNFALALMDIIGPDAGTDGMRSGAAGATVPMSAAPPGNFPGMGYPYSMAPLSAEAMRNAIQKNLGTNETARQALLTLADAAGYDPVKVRENIEAWYNSSMDRVSGWFKRTSQLTILALGFAVSMAINADTMTITNSLATDKAVRSSLISAAAEYARRPDASAQRPAPAAGTAPAGDATPPVGATPPVTAVPTEFTSNIPACQVDLNSPDCRFQSNLRQIRQSGLPLGWAPSVSTSDPRRIPQTLQDWLMKILGIGLTTLAISMGGPFWFDTLSKLIVVRSTLKPAEPNSSTTSGK
jgi:hypothetical protein